jgi:hypothetical protein
MSAAIAMMLLRVGPAGRGIANSSHDGILAFLEYERSELAKNREPAPIRYFSRTIFVVSRM